MAANTHSRILKAIFKLRFLLLGAVVLATALGLSRIRVDANVLDLLPQDLAAVRGLRIFLAHFGQPHELIVMIEAEDAATAANLCDSLAENLRSSQNLTVHSAPPWANDPRELIPLAAYALLNQPPEKFDAALEKFLPSEAYERASAAIDRLSTSMAPEEIARLAYDPLDLLSSLPSTASPDVASREFSSADGRTRILYATPRNPTPPRDWVLQTIRCIKSWQSGSPERMAARVGWTGEPAFVHEISSAMENDMRWSSISSLAFAAVIFFLAHRQLRPFWGILFYVLCSFAVALGLTALIFPGLSMISVGFAAILAGLTVDYGFIIYQRRIEHAEGLPQLRAATLPGILAGAVTTAAAFLSLNLSGLPGIAQLGTTVAVGVMAGALLMIFFYARDLQKIPLPATLGVAPTNHNGIAWAKAASVALLLTTLGALALLGFPQWTGDTNSMRPRESVAYPTLDRLGLALGNNQQVLHVIVAGEAVVSEKLALAREALSKALQKGSISSFELPNALWPDADFLKSNLASSSAATSGQEALRSALQSKGFSETGTFLTCGILDQWRDWQASGTSPLPRNPSFDWIARRTMSLCGQEQAACGVAVESGKDPAAISSLIDHLAAQGIYLTGWHKLGEGLTEHALGHGLRAGAAFLAVLSIALLLSLRNIRDTLLVLGITGLSILAMTGIMSLFSVDWNFMNLCSVTLTIGVGVDYSIHMIFALRQNKGDEGAAFRDVGKALGLCAATTVVGFGSLAASQTIGLASLGINCALGVGMNSLLALFLLPTVWKWLHTRDIWN